MYATAEKNNTYNSVNCESAEAEYAEIDQSNMKETSKHIYMSNTMQPVLALSRTVVKLQKDKVLYIQVGTIILICLIFLGMFAILFYKVVLLESTHGSSYNSQLNAQLDVLKKDFASILPGFAPAYLNLPASCAAVLEQNISSIFGYYFLRSHY